MLWQSTNTPTPSLVSTDEVIPLTPCDDNPTNRRVSFLTCLYFDEALDAEKLSNALEALLTSSREWRFLGGRLRLDPKGCAESAKKLTD